MKIDKEKQMMNVDIVSYLINLNEELKKKRKVIRLVIYGGAAMSLKYNNRRSTIDIDAIFNKQTLVRKLIDEIATSKNLYYKWINDDIRPVLSPYVKTSFGLEIGRTINFLEAHESLDMGFSNIGIFIMFCL